MMSRLAYFYILSKPCALNTPQALTKMENRRKAARFIIRFLKHKSNWFHRRILKRFTFLHKHGRRRWILLLLTHLGWRLRLYCRCFLRRKAVVLVRTFFHDFASFRLPYIMMKYRTNAIHLQRFVRSYVVITQVTCLFSNQVWSLTIGSHSNSLIKMAATRKHDENDAHSKSSLGSRKRIWM